MADGSFPTVDELCAAVAKVTPPALSESYELHVRSCRATGDRVGPNAARWRVADSRIRVTSEWIERSTKIATS